MGTDDNANDTVIHHIGAAKENAGRVTGNDGGNRESQDGPAPVQDAAERTGARVQYAARQRQDGFSSD